MVQYTGVNVEEAIHILLSFLVKRKGSSVSLVRSQLW